MGAALIDEHQPERAAAAGPLALESAGMQSAFVAVRLDTLRSATRYTAPPKPTNCRPALWT
ncbi:hypothetical protein [Embleya sp. NPDC050493]|uniref:hypothetical protein n=1 Tax=Embleya sp. NPDC050493 TaxID=3363989 RepID=UPI0037B3839E